MDVVAFVRYGKVIATIAVELNGGVWIRGRHNRGRGYIGDMEKSRAFQYAEMYALVHGLMQAGDAVRRIGPRLVFVPYTRETLFEKLYEYVYPQLQLLVSYGGAQ